jgi:predicted NUDIX family phosphoesterase
MSGNSAASDGSRHRSPAASVLPDLSILDAAELVLKQGSRSMHARELAQEVTRLGRARLSGMTPWKTVNARLSEDILRHGSASRFMRTDSGFFALRDEAPQLEFCPRRRRLNPIDETIKVIPTQKFLRALEGAPWQGLYGSRFGDLIDMSIDMPRRDAEETEEFVQLIPTFIVRFGQEILTYTRTKRLPEARLHGMRCISFGGHMQSDDPAPLFRGEQRVLRDTLLRELYEELEFLPRPDIDYLGILHLRDTPFERQHAGVVFNVSVADGAAVRSLEPGMHTDLRLESLEFLCGQQEQYDSWSRALLRVLDGQLK